MQMTQTGTPIYRRAVVGLLLVSFATFMLIYVVQPSFALIRDEFDATASTTSLTLSVTTFAIALTVLPVARLSSTVGKGRYMALSLSLAVVATLAAAFAPTMGVLLALRALSGVGFAGVTGVALAWVAEEAAPIDVARIGGIYIAGSTIGGMAGRLLGGLVADFLGWRGSLAAIAILSAVFTATAIAVLPRPGQMAAQRRATSDAPASADARGARGGQVKQVKSVPRDTPATRRNLRLIWMVGALGMFGFVGVYSAIVFRAAEPPMSMGPAVTSLFFITYLAGTVTSAMAGEIALRIGIRPAMLLGLVVAVAGVLVTLIPSAIAIWVGLLVMSAGFFLTHALASATGPRIASRPARASGSYTLWYYVGTSVGGYVLGAAWDYAGWSAVVFGTVVVYVGAALAVVALRLPVGRGNVAR